MQLPWHLFKTRVNTNLKKRPYTQKYFKTLVYFIEKPDFVWTKYNMYTLSKAVSNVDHIIKRFHYVPSS